MTSDNSPRPRARKRPACPGCGVGGRAVKAVTLESLVRPEILGRLSQLDGFRFCAEPTCDVAYYQPETGDRVKRAEVTVRIGQKETAAPRRVCYCFQYTAEQIEEDVARTGSSSIPETIAEKCRQGLDRCEETNPQGSCCLGNVQKALAAAQEKVSYPDASPLKPRMKPGAILQVGALLSAMLASVCCWLPLLLLSLGISGGALAGMLEPWRPVLVPVTLILLAAAFYFTYRQPKPGIPGAAGETDSCCEIPETSQAPSCCPSAGRRGFTIKKLNKIMLWVVTLFVLAFTFFPNYAGTLLRGKKEVAKTVGLERITVRIEGMTCAACAVTIEKSLDKVPGVAEAEVSYEKRQAILGFQPGAKPVRKAILDAIQEAGNYQTTFQDDPEIPSWAP